MRRATQRVTLSLLDEPLTRPLLQSGVPGVATSAHIAATVDANTREMLALGYDVAEMSFAAYLRARADQAPLLALPAFTGRRFTQPLMGTRSGAPARAVTDLPGSRVAVPQYWMSSSVWHRAVLRSAYGIEADQMSWVTTAAERFEGEPPGVTVERCSDGRGPVELVADGDADVALMPRPHRELVPLFDDLVAEQRRYHAATAIFPVMHVVVVRADLEERRPGAVHAVWRALLAARETARPGPGVPGVPDAEVVDVFGGADPWAYGETPMNTATVAALLGAVRADGLVAEPPEPEQIFWPGLTLPADERSSGRGAGAS